jgi:hypothetical protein
VNAHEKIYFIHAGLADLFDDVNEFCPGDCLQLSWFQHDLHTDFSGTDNHGVKLLAAFIEEGLVLLFHA